MIPKRHQIHRLITDEFYAKTHVQENELFKTMECWTVDAANKKHR